MMHRILVGSLLRLSPAGEKEGEMEGRGELERAEVLSNHVSGSDSGPGLGHLRSDSRNQALKATVTVVCDLAYGWCPFLLLGLNDG